jgi:hypothetical protein
MDERRSTQKPEARQRRGAASENETFLRPGHKAGGESMGDVHDTAQPRAASCAKRRAADVWALTLDDDQCGSGAAFYDE